MLNQHSWSAEVWIVQYSIWLRSRRWENRSAASHLSTQHLQNSWLSACNLQPPPPPRVSLIAHRCTSLLFQQSKFRHGLWPGRGPLVMCAYRPLQLSLGLLTRYSGGILNGRWGGGEGREASALPRLRTPTQICTICFVTQWKSLPPRRSHKSTHTNAPPPSSSSSPHLPTSIQAVLTLPSRQPCLKLKCQTTFHLQAVSHMHRGSETNTNMQC